MLTVIGLSSTAFGISVAGALLPLISVELFVLGMAMSGPELPWWLLALVIAAGQLGGKLLYYYAARGAIRVPRRLRGFGRAMRERGFLRTPDLHVASTQQASTRQLGGQQVGGQQVGGQQFGGQQFGGHRRWRQLLRHFRVLCRRHPGWAGVFLLVSAVLSLPPFAATAAVAGWARVSLSTFVVTAFVGRYVRFAGLAVAPALAAAWM